MRADIQVLVSAGEGNDVIRGGAGRNLFIGGTGADVIDGGGEEDLLIAGAILQEANPAAPGGSWPSGGVRTCPMPSG